MKYKYQILKSSWGIVILLDVELIDNYSLKDKEDIRVSERIYLRVNDVRKLKKAMIEYWIGKGIKDVCEIIHPVIRTSSICFVVNALEFSYVDFQEEGLYCAIQEWISKYYGIEIEPVNVSFDKDSNKYIFPFNRP